MKKKVMMLVTVGYLAVFFTALKLISGGFVYLDNETQHKDNPDSQTAREYTPLPNPVRRSIVSKFTKLDIQEQLDIGGNKSDLHSKGKDLEVRIDPDYTDDITEEEEDVTEEANHVSDVSDETDVYIPWAGQRVYEKNSNPYPFNFTLSPSPCLPEHELVIAVHSAAHVSITFKLPITIYPSYHFKPYITSLCFFVNCFDLLTFLFVPNFQVFAPFLAILKNFVNWSAGA